MDNTKTGSKINIELTTLFHKKYLKPEVCHINPMRCLKTKVSILLNQVLQNVDYP